MTKNLPVNISRDIPPDAFSVRSGLFDVLDQLEGAGLDTDQLDRLQIVLAEVLNNIVEHAHFGSGDGMISVVISAIPEGIRCIVKDMGQPLPSHLPKFTVSPEALDLADLPEGGFGWPLIRNLTSDLSASRLGDINTVSFNINAWTVG